MLSSPPTDSEVVVNVVLGNEAGRLGDYVGVKRCSWTLDRKPLEVSERVISQRNLVVIRLLTKHALAGNENCSQPGGWDWERGRHDDVFSRRLFSFCRRVFIRRVFQHTTRVLCVRGFGFEFLRHYTFWCSPDCTILVRTARIQALGFPRRRFGLEYSRSVCGTCFVSE